jgi:hypothetical protein
MAELDHVFVSAPWTHRDGDPYLIARVMEVLPAQSPSTSGTSASSSAVTAASAARVRVAYYLRPRDISNRYIADFRLIVATMHTGVVPASYVRGLCTVKHKETIGNLDTYKRQDNCFYWHQVGLTSRLDSKLIFNLTTGLFTAV